MANRGDTSDWLKWMRASREHERLVEAGFRCDSRRYVLRKNDRILVIWRCGGPQCSGRGRGVVLAITFDWLLPLTAQYPFHDRDGIPKSPEHFPISILAVELNAQRQRHHSPSQFMYHLNWTARECYPTRHSCEHDFPGGFDGPYETCMPKVIDIVLSDGVWLFDCMTPTVCLDVLAGIQYDKRTGWDKSFEDGIRNHLTG